MIEITWHPRIFPDSIYPAEETKCPRKPCLPREATKWRKTHTLTHAFEFYANRTFLFFQCSHLPWNMDLAEPTPGVLWNWGNWTHPINQIILLSPSRSKLNSIKKIRPTIWSILCIIHLVFATSPVINLMLGPTIIQIDFCAEISLCT